MTSLTEKDDLEVIKELNNLREKVLGLKAERNRVVEQLKNSKSVDIGEQAEKEISSEAMLGYIKKLIEDKVALGEEVKEREERIGDLVRQIQLKIQSERDL